LNWAFVCLLTLRACADRHNIMIISLNLRFWLLCIDCAEQGAMTKGYSTDAADAAVQASVVSAGYNRRSNTA
jgi:hypothetical protein